MHEPHSSSLPRHVGTNILPDFEIFHRLLYLARKSGRPVIRDVAAGIEADHLTLLSDIVHVRNAIWSTLREPTREKLLKGSYVAINLLCPGGYEFAVGFLAIVALGAVVSPISIKYPADEAASFARRSKAMLLLVASSYADLGNAINQKMRAASGSGPAEASSYTAFEVLPFIGKPVMAVADIKISMDHVLDGQAPGLIIFTSGTSGPPKGAVKKRSFLYTNARAIAEWYGISDTDVVQHLLPVHHATGVGVTFMPYILSGACIEFDARGFNAEAVWERWRKGGISVFSGVPTMYVRLMRHFQEIITKTKSPSEIQEYVKAAQSLRVMMSGSAALPRPLQKKWVALLAGKRILERYGSSEFSSVFSSEPGDSDIPDGSVGKIFPAVDVKLSNETEGEVLIKSPHLFIEYLDDPRATEDAFDPDGYYGSGDIARREGEYYFILGRASIDILKSGGYKISALDIEREILGLDYVDEVAVVGVDDDEFGQRVAAAIVLRGKRQSLTLAALREDLRSVLAGYKLPTLLRVMDELPKTSSGKVKKKQLPAMCFPETHPDVQRHNFSRVKL